MKTIVIDPGHGGYDYGAVNGNRREKDDNLRLGLALRDKLQSMGYNVVMTRSTDVFIPLLDRSRISNSISPDLFISLHRNSSLNTEAHGVENYIQYGSANTDRVFAQNVLNAIVNVGVQSNRGVREGDYSVLRNTWSPAQLLELGFISNATDNKMFDRYFTEYVNAIASGIQSSVGSATSGNASIRAIQQTLNTQYGAGLVVDGLFGANTKRALIKALQTELNNAYNAGLVVDGIWGNNTQNAVRIVRRGDRNNLVWILQAMLVARGANIDVDGIFGAGTESAVKSFQSANGLVADGIAGKNTFTALFK